MRWGGAGSDRYRDDIHRFAAGGKIEEDAGPRRRLWQDDNLRNGTWTVKEAGTEIVFRMEDNIDPFVWRIVALDDQGLKVT